MRCFQQIAKHVNASQGNFISNIDLNMKMHYFNTVQDVLNLIDIYTLTLECNTFPIKGTTVCFFKV